MIPQKESNRNKKALLMRVLRFFRPRLICHGRLAVTMTVTKPYIKIITTVQSAHVPFASRAIIIYHRPCIHHRAGEVIESRLFAARLVIITRALKFRACVRGLSAEVWFGFPRRNRCSARTKKLEWRAEKKEIRGILLYNMYEANLGAKWRGPGWFVMSVSWWWMLRACAH